ncbi:MAG: DUF512 domain-containing protein [Candidatus Cloacimonetes bacterium]|nr:DUF512 domain-containing protein [Candidatus Cloacimonadota bacterium]MCF7868487.1 DUF512 domain-containing protein [Candidatus Cloacimonadota bacterium]
MPLKIQKVHPESLAKENHILANEMIISINGNSINDFLDLQYHSADEILHIEIEAKNGEKRLIEIHQDWQKPLGIEPAPHRCRNCANNCIFCFIDQMRPDIRKSLYVKDDDFRLSFVYGNFITLTNLSSQDFNKIIDQRISPLYISVHTTNPILHKKMMRYKHDFNINKQLEMLSQNGIELHTQIVVVPGWNDGFELENSLQDLSSEKINALSIGIVPVGLTKYRTSLTKINKMTAKEAKLILNLSSKFPHTYCSDEIFLLADKPIPQEEYYDDYPQLENGIGMLRLLLENWKSNRSEFINFIKRSNNKFVFITGELAFNTIDRISKDINNELPEKIRTKKIINNFLGNSVTVTGLLAAEDIVQQIDLQADEILVIPGNVINNDQLTIDNLHISIICKNFRRNLILIQEEFEYWKVIEYK